MTEHDPTRDPHPDLVGLLRGELGNADALDAGEHLHGCEQCRAELAETAVGHALLARTRRTLAPPEQTRVASGESRDPVGGVESDDLPPLEVPRRRWSRPVALVAAAAVLVAGSVGATLLLDDDAAPPVAAPERSAPLEPVDSEGGGTVEMASAEDAGEVAMTVSTHDLPPLSEGEFYFVWLFDPSTEKMLGLGVMDPDGSASFEVPESLVGRYQVVDVSLENDDGDPGHSVTSVLRATYDEA